MQLKEKDIIVFAGDSTTDAGKNETGDRLGMGYVKLLHGMLNAFRPELRPTLVNAGISGNNSQELLARWEKDVAAYRPDIVFCMIGINDVWRHFDLLDPEKPLISCEEYEKNLEEIAKKGQAAREFVFMTPYYMERNRGDEMRLLAEQYASAMKRVAARHAYRIVDLQQEFDEYMRYRSGQSVSWDRVHPNEYGAMLIARAVWRVLQGEERREA